MTDSVNEPKKSVTSDAAPKPPGDIRRRVDRPKRKGPFVKYVGTASKRKITAAQWKSLGISLKDEKATHEWNVSNDFLVESSNFSDGQLDYLLVDDRQLGSGAHAFLEVNFDSKGNLVQV